MANIKSEIPKFTGEKIPVSHDQLQRELDYVRATRVLERMLDKGLICISEFNQITLLNRHSFSPALAQIMPETR
jgi:hypothetical protein